MRFTACKWHIYTHDACTCTSVCTKSLRINYAHEFAYSLRQPIFAYLLQQNNICTHWLACDNQRTLVVLGALIAILAQCACRRTHSSVCTRQLRIQISHVCARMWTETAHVNTQQCHIIERQRFRKCESSPMRSNTCSNALICECNINGAVKITHSHTIVLHQLSAGSHTHGSALIAPNARVYKLPVHIHQKLGGGAQYWFC